MLIDLFVVSIYMNIVYLKPYFGELQQLCVQKQFGQCSLTAAQSRLITFSLLFGGMKQS